VRWDETLISCLLMRTATRLSIGGRTSSKAMPWTPACLTHNARALQEVVPKQRMNVLFYSRQLTVQTIARRSCTAILAILRADGSGRCGAVTASSDCIYFYILNFIYGCRVWHSEFGGKAGLVPMQTKRGSR
jgi:hypothetical protein